MFIEEFGAEFATNYFRAIELLDDFYLSLPQNRMGQFIYLDCFGGIYVDCNGNLVILVTEDYAQNTNIVTAQSFSMDEVIVREVGFAYSTLLDTFQFLDATIPNNQRCIAASNVDGISFDVINNNVLVSLITLLIFFAGCADVTDTPYSYITGVSLPSTQGVAIDEVNSAIPQFSQNLFREVLRTGDENAVISPLSVYYVLAMVALGARGESLDEFHLDLVEHMQVLGLETAFGEHSDLSGLVINPNEYPSIFISELWQTVRIKVNRDGTEAAAVTIHGCFVYLIIRLC